MTVIDVLLIILLIIASALGIYVFIVLRNVNSAVTTMQEDMSQIVQKALPVLDNLKEVSEHAINISAKTDKQLTDLSNQIDNIKTRVAKYSGFGEAVSQENHIFSFVKNLKAFGRGISKFFAEIRNK